MRRAMTRTASAPDLHFGQGPIQLENAFPRSFCVDDSQVKYSSPTKGLGSTQSGSLYQPMGLLTKSAICVRETRKRSERKQRRRRSNALDLNFFQRCNDPSICRSSEAKPTSNSRVATVVKSKSLGSLGSESEGALQKPLGLKSQDRCGGSTSKGYGFEQHLEEMWQCTVKSNVAAALRNALSTARAAGHKVRHACMTMMNTEHCQEFDTDASVNGLGSAECCGLRAVIKRALRKGLGDEFKDLLASGVRVLEKLEVQRALLKALFSVQGTDEFNQNVKAAIDRSEKSGVQSPEFEIAKTLLAGPHRSQVSSSASPAVSPCHIRDDQVACLFSMQDSNPMAETTIEDSRSKTGSPPRSHPAPRLLKIFDKDCEVVDQAGCEERDTVGPLAEFIPCVNKLLSQQGRQTNGMLRRRAPPLASLMTEPWAGLDIRPLMEDGLYEGRPEYY